MTDDYGKKVGNALEAVRRMYSDVCRLLQDVGGTIGKGKISIFGNTAIRGGTMVFYKSDGWMPWWIYRYFADPESDNADTVDAVGVCFFDPNQLQRFSEPILLVGQFKYRIDPGQSSAREICREWDLAQAWLDWSGTPTTGAVQFGSFPPDYRTLGSFRVIAVPLFSVSSVDGVSRLLDTVRQSPIVRESQFGSLNGPPDIE